MTNPNRTPIQALDLTPRRIGTEIEVTSKTAEGNEFMVIGTLQHFRIAETERAEMLGSATARHYITGIELTISSITLNLLPQDTITLIGPNE